MKVTAIAYPIQGLIKYHGLRDARLRIPYHDSISVCLNALCTITTVEPVSSSEVDSLTLNGKSVSGVDLERVRFLLDRLRKIAVSDKRFRVASENSFVGGKGLGFSASAFAALGKAACKSLEFDIDAVSLSELVRVGAGSATRSLAGAFSLWYANRRGRSYAVQVAGAEDVDLGMIIVPLPSTVRTDEAHFEVLSSPLFKARLRHVKGLVDRMVKAIRDNDIETIGQMAEEDTLNLHASTMTGRTHMILWEPETVQIIKSVLKMRAEGLPAWFSMDTGPSVFINVHKKNVKEVANRLRKLGCYCVIESRIGGEPLFSDKHLF